MKNVKELLEFDKVLEFISKYAKSELGVVRCLEAKIFDDIDEIQQEINLTSEAKNLLNKFFIPPLNNIFDIKEFLILSESSITLAIDDLIKIAKVLKTSRKMYIYLNKHTPEVADLRQFLEKLYFNEVLENLIFDTFDENLNVKSTASAELKSLRNSLKDTENNLKSEINKLLNTSTFLDNLQDTIWTTRDDRVVFQVKAECKNKISGIVHDVSNSGQTFFIEPRQLIPINNKLKEIKTGILAEIERILFALTQKTAEKSTEILSALNNLVELDFIFAKAQYSLDNDFSAPILSENKLINIKSLKNPILMNISVNIVENDFYLDETANILIITGSNTGGKTVLIKTVGLIILMTKAGLHIPCYEGHIYPFKRIFADIGDEQSIEQSLSTFSSHLENIIDITENANNESFVILDEISAGTDPKEGASLAQSILEYLRNKKIFTLITTHYGELKSLAYTQNGFKNASVEFDTTTLSPTYKLLMDIPGASNAISIAENLGLNKQITEKAKQILFTQKDNTAQVLQKLQETQQTLSKSAKQTIEIEKSADALKKEFDEKLNKLKSEKKKEINIYRKKYEKELNEAKTEIAEILAELRKDKSVKVAHRASMRIANLERFSRKKFSEDEISLNDNIPINWDTLKLPCKAYLSGLEQQVEILAFPDKRGEVEIQMGMLKTKVKKDKLVQCMSSKNIKSIKPKKQKIGFMFDKHSLSNTLDLRGYRAEDALAEIDGYLDKASLANLTPVSIIHGHGTGILKKVIRDYISSSPYVSKYRAGENTEGGDGVTIVDLK